MKHRTQVLVVDDRQIVRDTLRNLLVDFSCDISEALDGSQALESIQEREFDVIFLDLRLPDRSGIDVLREARMLDKRLGRVIILTGFPEQSTRAEAESLGVFKYLTKPLDWSEIRSVFSEATSEPLVPPPAAKRKALASRSGAGTGKGHRQTAARAPVTPGSRPRLLVLDDQRKWLDTIEQVLGTEFELTLTTSVSEACRRASRARFDLVVLDMRLVGGVSGLDVLSRMRRANPGLRALILTGYPDFKSATDAGRRGAIDYVSKGDLSTLSERVRGILSENARPTRVFLSYDRRDKARVSHLYHRLLGRGFLPWMDIKSIVAGTWEPQIKRAIRESDYFVFFLSNNSIYREGILRRELRQAFDRQEGLLDDSVFIITARLEDVEVEEPLNRFHYIDLFRREGFQHLLRALSSNGRTAV